MFSFFLSVANCLLASIFFAVSVKAVDFNCKFEINTPWNLELRYSCIATVIDSGSRFLENVEGIHFTGKTNADVEYLFINNQNLPFIPEGIDNFFNKLDIIKIDYSSLLSLSADDLRPFPRLLFLTLWSNRLISIDGDLFKHNPHLEYVSFADNQIQHIGHDLVTNLNNLTNLYFTSNVCIDRWASTRNAVLSLAPELSILCPQLDVTTTTTTTTTTTATTTGASTDQCFCDEEIDELHELNRALEVQVDKQNSEIEQQNKKIEQLMELNDAFEERLLEVEMKLREIGSMP